MPKNKWLKFKPFRLNAIVDTPRDVNQIPNTVVFKCNPSVMPTIDIQSWEKSLQMLHTANLMWLMNHALQKTGNGSIALNVHTKLKTNLQRLNANNDKVSSTLSTITTQAKICPQSTHLEPSHTANPTHHTANPTAKSHDASDDASEMWPEHEEWEHKTIQNQLDALKSEIMNGGTRNHTTQSTKAMTSAS